MEQQPTVVLLSFPAICAGMLEKICVITYWAFLGWAERAAD